MKTTILTILFLFCLLGTTPVSATHPAIEGVMGVVPALENSCASVWLPIPQGQAITGLEWFNNDATVAFPGLFFESGNPDEPVALSQYLIAAQNVTGDSAAWSTVLFAEPVTSAGEGLYILFQFPEGIEVSGFGSGGGPAIGYVAGGFGASGWLCADGESWTRVGGDFGFAVSPIFVDATDGMTQLNGTHGPIEVVELVLPLVTSMDPPFPNPFNPETNIHFSLAKAQTVDLSVYFARFRAGDVVTNHRVVLVK